MAAKIGKLQREIAERLWLLRMRLFGNASEMARSIRLSPQRWYNYETGRRALDADIAALVVEEHGVDFNWLYGGVTTGLSRKTKTKLALDQPLPERAPRKPRRKRPRAKPKRDQNGRDGAPAGARSG